MIKAIGISIAIVLVVLAVGQLLLVVMDGLHG